MSIRSLVLSLIAALGWGLSAGAPASADETPPRELDTTRRGFYVGAAGLYAVPNFDRDAPALSGSGGLSTRIGFRGDPYIAEEIEFAWKSGFSSSSGRSELVQYDLTLNFKWFLPLGRFHPYALTGIGAVFSRERGDEFTDSPGAEDNAFLAKLGLGVEAYATDHIVANVAFDYGFPVSNGHSAEDQFASFTFGLLYRF